MGNTNLNKAKTAKKDEFYTMYDDIGKEMNAYLAANPDVFKDKVILFPCDDPEWSNFPRWFEDNKARTRHKRLITSFYNHETREGDFRSPEVTKLRDEADIVITNPPFSIWRSFFDWVNEGNNEYIILGTLNSITYKNVFPYIRGGLCKLTASRQMKFALPDHYDSKLVENGVKYAVLSNAVWYSNIQSNRSPGPFVPRLKTKEENEKDGVVYPLYDNYDAFNCDKSKHIPKDEEMWFAIPESRLDSFKYTYGEDLLETKPGRTQGEIEVFIRHPVFGVPVSFIEKMNEDEFEFVGSRCGNGGKDLVYMREREFNRTFESL